VADSSDDPPARDGGRELAIEILARSEAELKARVASLEADNQMLRESLSAVLEAFHGNIQHTIRSEVRIDALLRANLQLKAQRRQTP
jgi:hypothetical protein